MAKSGDIIDCHNHGGSWGCHWHLVGKVWGVVKHCTGQLPTAKNCLVPNAGRVKAENQVPGLGHRSQCDKDKATPKFSARAWFTQYGTVSLIDNTYIS